MRQLSAEKRAKLEQAWRDGDRVYRAMRIADVAYDTVRKYWRRFRLANMPRAATKPYRRRVVRDREPPSPSYKGPTMIGKAISGTPIARGPDWIGKPCPPSTS